ncbi:hypothetical protein Hdeb2414_s0025g00658211 [Helianthus debilis subsp. tardiflorus]
MPDPIAMCWASLRLMGTSTGILMALSWLMWFLTVRLLSSLIERRHLKKSRVMVVGRTVNLETLVDLDRLLRIAKVSFSRIQYLGGLSTLISFPDAASANNFLVSRVIWGPWFSNLKAWKGQSLPLERVAWLKVHGIPLHLLDIEVIMQVGEMFGKVMHSPKSLEEEHDLSLVTLGVLAGEAHRIRECVALKWKGRTFRIWGGGVRYMGSGLSRLRL